VLTASDSDGFIYDPSGIDAEKLAFLMQLKNVKRGRINEYAEKYKVGLSCRANTMAHTL
jgi:glutamate dehydrogenase/leucine dehydrogenase